MSQLIPGTERYPERHQSSSDRKQPPDSPWLWLVLLGGSLVAHWLLATIVLHATSRLSVKTQANAQVSYASIDFVELPDPAISTTAAKPASQPTSNPTSQSTTAQSTTAAPASTGEKPTQPLASSTAAHQARISVVPPLVRPAAEPTQPTPASPAPAPAEALPIEPAAAPSSIAAPLLEPEAIDRPVPAPLMGAGPTDRSIPSPSAPPAESPSLLTEAIAVPVPDVSAALPPSETSVSPLPQLVIGAAIAVPRLSASLEVDRLPVEAQGHPGEPMPEVIAAPKHGLTSQTFVNPVAFPCLPLVTPEADQFWGETVAVQVSTDAAGQVTGTQVQQSSDSPAYDNLAKCIVEHWEFEPARIKNQPVPSSALLLRVRLEQG